MDPEYAGDSAQKRSTLLLFSALALITIVIAVAAVVVFDRSTGRYELFQLGNLVGVTAQNLLQGSGIGACSDGMGTPGNPICFHAGRMPLPTLTVALGILVFGNHFLTVNLFKALFFLIPVEISIGLVISRLRGSSVERAVIAALLLLPFGCMLFLADVVNMQVEEGYTYGLMALCLAILLFPRRNASFGQAILFAFAVDGIYLAKSSMSVVAAVLVVGYLVLERRTAQRLVLLALTVAAPVGWAIHQHHASGRYSVGTSIDGMNLHKGNNADFLSRYPPPSGVSLDNFDNYLNQGLYFSDEWSFNDYHQHAAVAYMRAQPGKTFEAALRKLHIFFFGIEKSGSAESHGLHLAVETAGILLFRIVLWAAILGSLYALFRPTCFDSGIALSAAATLGIIAACALPYVVGFAYTRHAGVLFYPASLMCCRLLTGYRPNAAE